jgi:hypothetical protein
LLGTYAGFPYDYQSKFGGGARVDFHFPYSFTNSNPQQYVQPLWEFFASKSERDLLSNDLPLGQGATFNGNGLLSFAGFFPSFGYQVAGIGSLTAGDAFLVRQAQQLSQQGIIVGIGWFSAPVDAAGNPLTYSPDGTNPTNKVNVPAAINPIGCNVALTLFMRGQSASISFSPTLRFTQTVTSQYAIRASLLNVGKIISTATLMIIENIPNGLLFNLPNPSNPAQQFYYSNGDLVYGWFKDFPTVRQIARLKWNIVQEWQFGLWSVATYGTLL